MAGAGLARHAPANLAPEEHDELEWFDVDELPPPAHVPVRTALLDAIAGSDVENEVGTPSQG